MQAMVRQSIGKFGEKQRDGVPNLDRRSEKTGLFRPRPHLLKRSFGGQPSISGFLCSSRPTKPKPAKPTAVWVGETFRALRFRPNSTDVEACSLFHGRNRLHIGMLSYEVAGFGFASFLAHFFPKRSGMKNQRLSYPFYKLFQTLNAFLHNGFAKPHDERKRVSTRSC